MRWLRWALAPLPLCVAFALVVMIFSLVSNRNCFELGTDGAGWQTYIDYQVSDRAPFSQLGVDAHQGDFDAYYPLDNDYTLPGAVYRLLGKSEPPGAVPTYAVYTVVLALTVFLLCKFIGLDAATACIAAFIAMFFFPPLIVHHPAPTFRFLHLNPHWMQLIIFSVLAICSFWALDGKWKLGRILLMFVPAICATVEVMSVGAMIIFTPAVALYGGASLLFSQNRQAAVQKLGARSDCTPCCCVQRAGNVFVQSRAIQRLPLLQTRVRLGLSRASESLDRVRISFWDDADRRRPGRGRCRLRSKRSPLAPNSLSFI